jgi:ubiquinone/menaquinone biosynthesis C-methylase UbiE
VADLRQRYFAWLMSVLARRYNTALGPRKRALFGDLKGTVVEIGPGTGANLEFLPPGVQWVGIEPNVAMHAYLERVAARHGVDVELERGFAHRIARPDGSVDAIVSTLVLCSVRDLDQALAEIFRVLRPGGRFLFLEHVAAERGTWLRRTQDLVRPVWAAINDNCQPNRETEQAIANAGFVDLRVDRIDGPLPIPVIRPHIVGSARRPE